MNQKKRRSFEDKCKKLGLLLLSVFCLVFVCAGCENHATAADLLAAEYYDFSSNPPQDLSIVYDGRVYCAVDYHQYPYSLTMNHEILGDDQNGELTYAILHCVSDTERDYLLLIPRHKPKWSILGEEARPLAYCVRADESG